MGRHKGLTPDDYRRLANEGLTQTEAAAQLGVTKQSVANMARRHDDIAFVVGKPGPKSRQAVEE
jgi:hypothetical protein